MYSVCDKIYMFSHKKGQLMESGGELQILNIGFTQKGNIAHAINKGKGGFIQTCNYIIITLWGPKQLTSTSIIFSYWYFEHLQTIRLISI